MKVEIKSATALRSFGTQFLQQIRGRMVKIIAKDVERQIKEKSKGQFKPKIDIRDNGATLGIPADIDDPNNQKIIGIENQTNAVKGTNENLSNKAYVANLINRELK